MRRMAGTAHDDVRTILWAHGRAQVQRLGAMLGPVVFRSPGHVDFSPLHVAPWADEAGISDQPGILRRLRGEWPCVPFGRADALAEVPSGWSLTEADDGWSHGFGSNHAWEWLPSDDPLTLRLQSTYPPSSPVQRLVRTIRALADDTTLDMSLQIEVRRRCTLPVALHPTVRLDLGLLDLTVPHGGACLTYPVSTAPDVSRLAIDRRFADLSRAPTRDGAPMNLARYPQSTDSEELVQVMQVTGPVSLDYLDQSWRLNLEWDLDALPDVMLWVSHRGRRHAPWSGRHLALGVEPLNGAFDLGRVAVPPGGHPLAARRGIALEPEAPALIRYRLSARAA
jgi:hypothetical protein